SSQTSRQTAASPPSSIGEAVADVVGEAVVAQQHGQAAGGRVDEIGRAPARHQPVHALGEDALEAQALDSGGDAVIEQAFGVAEEGRAAAKQPLDLGSVLVDLLLELDALPIEQAAERVIIRLSGELDAAGGGHLLKYLNQMRLVAAGLIQKRARQAVGDAERIIGILVLPNQIQEQAGG